MKKMQQTNDCIRLTGSHSKFKTCLFVIVIFKVEREIYIQNIDKRTICIMHFALFVTQPPAMLYVCAIKRIEEKEKIYSPYAKHRLENDNATQSPPYAPKNQKPTEKALPSAFIHGFPVACFERTFRGFVQPSNAHDAASICVHLRTDAQLRQNIHALALTSNP
jgi:hypothetical protein